MLQGIMDRRAGFLVAGWGLLAVAVLACAAIMVRLGMSVTTRDLWAAGAAMLLLLALAQIYARREPRICALADACAFLLATTVMLIAASYVAAACGGAPWDAQIARFDGLLGFDWPAQFAFFKAHPALMLAMGYIYNSFLAQPLAIIFVLSLTGQLRRLRLFMLLFAACGLVVVVLSGLMPALGAFAHYMPGTRIAAIVYGHAVGPEHLTQLLSLRDGSLRVIPLADAVGLVSFPSFHAAASVLFAWALARTPWLAVPALVLNALVVVSTLPIGGHYLTDVVAGAALAGVAVAALAGRSPASVSVGGHSGLPAPASG